MLEFLAHLASPAVDAFAGLVTLATTTGLDAAQQAAAEAADSGGSNIFAEAGEIWAKGGTLMIPLALLAGMIYFTAFGLIFHIQTTGLNRISEETTYAWVQDPSKAEGRAGEIIRYTQTDVRSLDDIVSRFAEVKAAHLPPIDGRIQFLNTMVTVSPLMGLLGTVIGMLATFAGLAVEVGRTIDLVAAGISEALITTQTGLVIAIPGYVFVFMIQRGRDKLETFLTRLESGTMQKFDKQLRQSA